MNPGIGCDLRAPLLHGEIVVKRRSINEIVNYISFTITYYYDMIRN